jgi:hypothetical protein
LGCDIHLYVEKRQADGTWAVVKGPNPRIEDCRLYAAKARERGDEDRAKGLEEEAASIESGAKAQYEPDEDGYLSESRNPEIHQGWLYDGRNYDLFAILANVRNGRGFAGVKTGLGFNPIAEPKGLPEDVSGYVKAASDQWDGDGHSHSWHTLADLLAYDWHQMTFQHGVVDENEYKVFKETGEPNSWCGDVGGQKVRHITPEEMDALLAGTFEREADVWYHTRLQWPVTYNKAANHFYVDSLPKLQELAGDDPASARIVFWFDN